jgi:hypothetical protein
VEEIGIAVFSKESARQLAVLVPVGCAGMEIALQFSVSVLNSKIKVVMFGAMLAFHAPKLIPTVPAV